MVNITRQTLPKMKPPAGWRGSSLTFHHSRFFADEEYLSPHECNAFLDDLARRMPGGTSTPAVYNGPQDRPAVVEPKPRAEDWLGWRVIHDTSLPTRRGRVKEAKLLRELDILLGETYDDCR